jgi:hypothetical protein
VTIKGIVAATLFEGKSSLPLYDIDIARYLGVFMRQETLLGLKTRAVLTSEEYLFSGVEIQWARRLASDATVMQRCNRVLLGGAV